MPDQLERLTFEGIIHDLNNVFETLFEAAELLREDPKHAKLAGIMKRSLKHGSRIVRSLEEQEGHTDVDQLIEQANALLQDYLISSRGPRVELIKHGEENLKIRGARGAWERVFVNLFFNASRMMPEGGTIEVWILSTEQHVQLVVRDTGPGIPLKLLPKLFEAGFSTTPRHKGLGLHIVRSIAEELGGSVTAANREDHSGAEFRILLPRDSQLAVVAKSDPTTD